ARAGRSSPCPWTRACLGPRSACTPPAGCRRSGPRAPAAGGSLLRQSSAQRSARRPQLIPGLLSKSRGIIVNVESDGRQRLVAPFVLNSRAEGGEGGRRFCRQPAL